MSNDRIALKIRQCADVAWDLGGEKAKSLSGRLHSIAAELKAEQTVTTLPGHLASNDCVNYLSAGDNPYASGDRAYTGCSLCGRPRSEHTK